MGLFNRNNGSRVSEKIYEINGFVIGVNSHKIYHVPKMQMGATFMLPNGATDIAETAISEMRSSKPQQIIVPSSFQKFNFDLSSLKELREIALTEGVEEVDCLSRVTDRAVQINLPSTIKKIGKNCYPVVQHLVLPKGTIEIAPMFASHDTNLLSINIPGTLKNIPAGAFNQCKNLQSVILNEGVESSTRDAFCNTNNLRLLEIPSTYNGTIDLTMESRGGSNVRGNSKYVLTRFNEEKNSILKIKIKRGDKKFEFNIIRGECPNITIKQNIIQIKCSSQQQSISIDCDYLEQGIYNIANGNVRMQQHEHHSKITEQSNSQEEIMSKLDIIFQNAYRENITKRDDFKGLSSAVKMQIKKSMRELFMQNVRQFGSMNTSYENFDYLYRRVLSSVVFEETISHSQNNMDSGGKKR